MKVQQIIDEIQASLTKLREQMRLTGTAGECTCPNVVDFGCKPLGVMPHMGCPQHGWKASYKKIHKEYQRMTHPDLPLHARVAKANGKEVRYIEGVAPGWHYWNPHAHGMAQWVSIPDYPNDLVAATEAFDRYFELQCRKIDDRFDYWIERFYKDGWKWRVRLGFADKSVVADSQEEALCLAIVAHAEGK